MIENVIDYGQPEAGAVINEAIDSESSARLNYNLQDVSEIEIGDSGELIITFKDSGQLILADFEDFNDAGNSLYFQDGTLIDPNFIASSNTSIVNKPDENGLNVVNLEEGKNYVCDFDPANAALVEVKDGQMVLTFADGSQVVLNNYSDVMAGDLPAELSVADGTVVTEEELLTQVTAVEEIEEVLEVAEVVEETEGEDSGERVANIEPATGEESVAEALAQIEPAAGDSGAPGNSGYGFNSATTPVSLDAPGAIGPLGPTALNYVAPQFVPEQLILNSTAVDDRPDITPESVVLDETAFSTNPNTGISTPLVANGTVVVDFGNDGPGTITGTGSTSLQNNFLLVPEITSSGVTVDITFDSSTNTYTGTAGGVTVFTMVMDPISGDYTYTQLEPLDHNDPTNSNEPITISFQYAAEDADGDVETTAVQVSILDDAPIVTSQVATSVDETDFSAGPLVTTGQFFTDPGEDVVATFPGNDSFNATGSVDNNNLSSNGVDVVVTFDSTTNTYTGVAGAVTVFTMEIDSTNGSYTYTQLAPLDHADDNDPNDVLELNFGVNVVDFDGDKASGFVTVNVFDDAPVTGDDSNIIDETNLGTGPIVINDSVSVNFGGDGQGSLTASGTFTPSGSVDNGVLSHGGSPITVTSSTTGYTGVDGNGVTVFTLEIDPLTGDYTFTLLENLDHADNNDPNDIITLTFGTTITDFDGDREPGQIIVNIQDDAPTFQPNGPQPDQGLENTDETDLDGGPLVETGTLTADFGEDGPGTYEGSDNFEATGSVSGPGLSSCGEPVTVTFDSQTNTYTGALVDGTEIFTLVIDANTGDYTYTQTGTLDHADGTNPNDVITLTFGVDAVDSEGEGANGSIVINVADDAPELDGKKHTLDESDLTVGGALSVSSSVVIDHGNDGAGTFSATGTFASGGSQLGGTLSSNGVPVVTNYDSTTNTYTGIAGGETIFTMTVNTDGTYTFTLLKPLDHADPNDPNDIINLDFGIQTTDKDGDVAVNNIRIDIKDDVPTINGSSGDVDETNLDAGPIVYIDTIETDVGQNISTITFNGDTSSSTPLTSCGNPVTISQNGNTYTGVANGVTIFTLTIDATTGQYTYTQFEPLDHPDSTDPDDILSIDFGVVVTTLDGSTETSTITINVADDGPDAVDDINGGEEGQFITGDVVANDLQGQDTATVTNVSFNGTDFPVVAGTATTIVGNYGTLVINNDGTYNYTTNTNDPDGVDSFTYTLTDKDGDTDTAVLEITVTPDGQPVQVSKLLAVDETNLTPGPMIFNGNLDVDFGIDGAGSTTATGASSFVAGGSLLNGTLTSGGVPVVVTLSGNTYTGTAGSVTVFDVTINPDGTYQFQLFDHIDHADSTDPNDIITLEFGIEATDADGDSTEGTFTVYIHDDAPVAYDDINGAEEGQTITGDVVANDEQSEDDPSLVTNVNFEGTDYPVVSGAATTVVGNFGTLVINNDGTYTYTANTNDPDGVDEFTYTLTDFDGDQDTAELTITVTPDGQPVAVNQSIAVDETNLTPGPMIFNGDLNVDFGLDGPGTVTAQGANTFVAGGSLTGGTLTSGGVPVVVTLSGNTYTGTAGSITVFDVTINPDGTYQFQLFDHIDHADSTDPNDIITLQFGVTATDPDGDSADGFFTVLIHDDAPVAYDDGTTSVDESQSVNGNVLTNDESSEDRPTDVVQIGLSDATGAIIPGTAVSVPSTGTATINGQFGVLVIAADGTYTYTANANNPDGTDNFTYVIEDFDGDQDTAEFSFVVSPLNDVPIIVQPPIKTVDDTNLDTGPNTVTGNVEVNYGGDAPGEVNLTGALTSSVALTSCGHPIETSLNGNVLTGTANGVTVFTITVLEDGSYTFTQFEAIDHPNTLNPNDNVRINFNVTATDADGDTASTTIRINILDDGPQIDQIAQEVDEGVITDTNPLVANGSIDVDFGEDGPGEVTTNGLFEAKFQRDGSNVTLSSGGSPITVTNTDNMYTGTDANGNVVFTLQIDSATGDYTYTQFDAIDHPDATDPDDVIWLKFYVDVHDCDGDMDTGIIIIDVHDDGPTANNDTGSVSRTETTETGNVLTNDDAGVDNSSVTVTTVGTFIGTFGTLVLNANGSYTYTRNGSAGGIDTFEYTMQDADGDTDTAILTINVEEDNNPINISGSGETDDTVVGNDGSDTETGTINVNYQGDGPGTTTGNGNFTSGGSLTNGTLSHNGVPIAVTFSALTNTYTGTAGSETIFTMVINANGTYTFTQLESLDHSNTASNNEAITLNFGVTATDSDGDTGTGTVAITVRDDGPLAVDDRITQVDFVGGDTFIGNLLTNDDLGGDGPAGTVVTFGHGVYNTPHGTLTVNQDGSYSFVVNRANLTPHNYELRYIIQDADGDTSEAMLRFSVTPLVLDLDGDGIELTDTQNGVLFDYDNDGELEQTAWVSSDDGFLVLDRNNDGLINNRSEMFGDMFGHEDGFAHLASMDTNNDGLMSNQDAGWSDLRVWRDLNQDGISDEGELFGLDDLGIQSINVADITQANQSVGDNYIGTQSTYTTTDGNTHNVSDVHLDYEDDSIDLSQYLVSQNDELMMSAIQEGIETNEVLSAGSEMSVESAFFVDQSGSIDEAINDFVSSTANEPVCVTCNETANENMPSNTAAISTVEITDSETVI